MRTAYNRQRTCMGGWLLAALLIGGINAYQFMILENQPLVGYSQTIKTLQANLQEFDKTLTNELFSLASQIENLVPKDQSKHADRKKNAPPVSVSLEEANLQMAEPPVLPTLTGIMHVVNPDGAIYYQAVLNGRVCRTMEKIDDFTVVRISPAGVVVRHSGLNWTIDSPDPYYSSDQGT